MLRIGEAAQHRCNLNSQLFCLRRLPKWEFNVVVRGEIEVQDHLDILQIVGATKIHRFNALPERFGFGLAVQPDTAFSEVFSRDTILHQDSHSPTFPPNRAGCK